jgi:hypothetical protein
VPLSINTLQLKIKEIQAFPGLPAHRSRTDSKALGGLLSGSQPLKRIERSQGIQINQCREPRSFHSTVAI